MKVHHFNAGTMCPSRARFINGRGGFFERGTLVCHVLLAESRDGLVLVDTGLGLDDIADPARLGRKWLKLTAPRLSPEEAAVTRIRALGFDPKDVRHVVVTHLDRDHAGGISDFPNARVHVHRTEYEVAAHDPRFRRAHVAPLAARGNLRLYDDGGERWFGFEGVRALDEREPEILLVPLRGHTRGHTAVAVRGETRWVIHAGDGYYFHGQMEARPRAPIAMRLFQRLADADRPARVQSQARLRELALAHASEVDVFCAHDPVELERHAGAALNAGRADSLRPANGTTRQGGSSR